MGANEEVSPWKIGTGAFPGGTQMTVGQGWQLGKRAVYEAGESEGKRTHKSALTTSNLDTAVDLQKPLACSAKELPTNFHFRLHGRDLAGA